MTKVNKPGSRKPNPNPPKAAEAKKPTEPQAQAKTAKARQSQSGESNKPHIGGTAVPGARSTQPREVKATSPAQQQAESYNRDMRRRMQHLGTGPYGEDQITAAQEKRQKRIDRRKKRVEERQQEAKKAIGPGFRATLGRRNTYFLVAVVAILVIAIVIAFLVHNPFR